MILFFSWMNFYPKWMIPITGKVIVKNQCFQCVNNCTADCTRSIILFVNYILQDKAEKYYVRSCEE